MYPNLEAEMARNKITKDKIAKFLKVRYATIHDKMSGRIKRGFTVNEALAIKEKFFPDLTIEYLFQRKASDQIEQKGA